MMPTFSCQLLFVSMVVTVGDVGRHLDTTHAPRAVQMVDDGVSQAEVSRRPVVSFSVIHRLINCYEDIHSYARMPGAGHPKAITAHQDHYLMTNALWNHFVTAKGIKNDIQRVTGHHVSSQTVRNRIHEQPARGVILMPRHHRERVYFAREYRTGMWLTGPMFCFPKSADLP